MSDTVTATPAKRTPLVNINKDTLVPIGLLIAVVMSSVSLTWWLQGALVGLEHRVSRLADSIDALRSESQQQWKVHDMRMWAELLQARNTTLSIPIPSNDRK